ncbi:MAG: 3-dehydroquinate synthase [Pseudomonadota bacterium]
MKADKITLPESIQSAQIESVQVDCDQGPYLVHIGHGLTDQIADYVARIAGGAKRAVLLSDETCLDLFGGTLNHALRARGLRVLTHSLPPGETSKSFHELERALEAWLAFGIERTTPIIALGGGVVGDLAGLAAALALRGVPVIQVPTTLLAQIDSSVGGKTAINSKAGKNLIGVFYQPRAVFAELAALDQLPMRQLRAGYAEAVKYALIDDPDFFIWMESNLEDVLKADPTALGFMVKRCVKAKARIVALDSHEHGIRALLNLGHSFAHALESACGYGDQLLHGEAVAVGMVLAFEYSEQLGICESSQTNRVKAHLQKAGLPVCLRDLGHLDAEILLAFMRRDKKARDSAIILILVRGIGKAFISDPVDQDHLRDALHQWCRG